MVVELHCHSTCSDGSVAPEEVARRAADRGVELFCLTDHDTMAGHPRTAAALAEGPARVLCGLELSCHDADRTIHLLVYGVREGAGKEALERLLEDVIRRRRERLEAIVDRLAALGITLDAAAILEQSRDHTPGRPDVARALLAAGAVQSLREAFDRFLHDGGPADVPIARLTLAEGLEFGRACGARMSLAHPHTLRSYPIVGALFRRHKSAGLEGIEAYYGRYGAAERLHWSRLADELGLVITGGSDFHGEALPEVTRPGISMPAPLARRLVDWLEPS
ncbi:MAG: PHP domain-containing protein [Nannocystaceae bacterium]